MAARARDLFLQDPTDQLIELAGTTATMPVRSVARTWVNRTAAVAVSVPLTMGGLSFGIAEAANLAHVGVARGKGAVFVAAILDHRQVAQPTVVAALRSHTITTAVGTADTAPTPTDIVALNAAGLTVVGLDTHHKSRNPKRLISSIRSAAAAVDAAGDTDPKVVCLATPGFFEQATRLVRDVELAHPDFVVKGGDPIPDALRNGKQLVLDERGRTAAQVTADFDRLSQVLASEGLPEKPMRDLWPMG
jgi:hypothetical protein